MRLRASTGLLLAAAVGAAASDADAYYDAFPPSEGPYASGPASASLPWGGENFEGYSDGQVIEASNNKSAQPHLDVTSGTLESKYVQGSSTTYRRGWTDDHHYFRAVAIGRDAQGREIKWTDQISEFRAYIHSWKPGVVDTSGIHIFGRYRTSLDLYVASLRYDGDVTIKRKWDSDNDQDESDEDYTELERDEIDSSYLDGNGHLQTGRWYTLRFEIIDDDLTFYVDGQEVLSATSGTFSWGTFGIRIDHANAYIDDWKLIYPNPEPSSAALLLGAAAMVFRRRRKLTPARR